ncbi:MAG: DUF1501 domain-containing protein [Acidobacteriota bacterium]|nr:DUF1501 domain-containing protein [Acidobacteriota bacterium]
MSSRRQFIQTTLAGSAALAGFTACSGGSSSSGTGGGPPPPPPPPAIPGPILVLVQIQGGNDWLSMTPPTSGANAGAYAANRPALATPASNLTDLGSGVGLNKDCTGFDLLHAAGRIAWIPGVGMQNPNLSHFTATDFWSQGATVPDGTGWLGRWGDAAFAPTDVLRGIATTSDIILMNHGRKRDFVAVTSSADFNFPTLLRSTTPIPDSNFLKSGYLYSLTNPGTVVDVSAAASEGKLFYDAASQFSGLITTRTPSVPYPGDTGYAIANVSTQLASQLKLVAQMIASGIPGQVYTVRLGGFDTHSNQLNDYPRLMRALGGSIKAFYDDLGSITTTVNSQTVKAQDRVMVVGWSEFGRRIKENNGGTDHGTAILSFALGNMVKGGFYGQGYPDLTKPDSNGNMVFTTDFRSLYATLLERFLGYSDSKGILGATYPTLGFL